MKSNTLLTAMALALFAQGISPAGRAAAQEPVLRRDVPPPVARDCRFDGTLPAAFAVSAASARPVEPQEPAEAARLVASAREAALLGDPRTARDLLARAASADTSAANVAFLFARTLEELNELDEAAHEYCRYVRLAPDAPDAEDVRRLVQRIAPPVRPGIPDSAAARFHAALALFDAGRASEAELAFTDVIAAAPSWAAPYYNRALLRMGSNRRGEAHADFERFLALEPSSPDEARVRSWMSEPAVGVKSYSAGAAFAYGLIPGAGHFYTGRPIAGTTLLAVAGGAAAFGVLYKTRHVECLGVPENGACPAGQVRAEFTERPYLLPAAGVAAAATILGALDAARGARSRNERTRAADAAVRIGSAVHVGPARVDVALFRLRF